MIIDPFTVKKTSPSKTKVAVDYSQLPQMRYVSIVEENHRDDDLGFLYSYNNPSYPDHTEFVVHNVPYCKRNAVAGTINFLSRRKVQHGQTIQSHGLELIARLVTGDEKQGLLKTHCCTSSSSSIESDVPLIELLPRYKKNVWTHWGGRPPAPEGNDRMVNSIMNKWYEQNKYSYFVLHIDGDVCKNALSNIKMVELAAALRHIDDWTVDWNHYLTCRETDFVRTHTKHFIRLVEVEFYKQKCAVCESLGTEDRPLERCGKCHRVFYCCPEHRKLDCLRHRKECEHWASMMDNKPMKVMDWS